MELAERKCDWCGEPFFSAVPNQIRCSHRCTRRAAKYRERKGQRGGIDIPDATVCVTCGQTFKPYSVKAKYCSERCHNRGRDKRRAHRWRIKRDVVFERDGWVCRWCDKPIDRSLRHPDPLAATVDHIVPLIKGGSDAVENLQAMHMVCNAAKGDA